MAAWWYLWQRGSVGSGGGSGSAITGRWWRQLVGGGSLRRYFLILNFTQIIVGERRTNGMREILPDIEILLPLPCRNTMKDEVPRTQNGIVLWFHVYKMVLYH